MSVALRAKFGLTLFGSLGEKAGERAPSLEGLVEIGGRWRRSKGACLSGD